jgi:transcriptional regulator with XRE-family HTH domain
MYIRLRDLREDRDENQSTVAKHLGYSQQTYSRYENGITEPSLETLINIANYFNTSIDYLLGLTDEPKPYPRRKKQSQ